MKNRLAACLFLIAGCAHALACTCGWPSGVKNMRDMAEARANAPDHPFIFEGKVTKQELHNGDVPVPANAMSMTGYRQNRVVEFAVVRTFRGAHADNVSVLTGLGGSDCGCEFQTGETYLVYADQTPEGAWETSICSGTSAIEDAGPAVRFFTGERPLPEDLLPFDDYDKYFDNEVAPKQTGSVCGRVTKPNGKPLEGARVQLWELRDDDLPSRSFSDPNTSDKAGHFCIERARPGRYLLTAESDDFDHDSRLMAFYPGVDSRRDAIPIQMERGVRLRDVKFTTFREALYTIKIRVVTPEGTPPSCKYGCAVTVHSVYRDPLSYHIGHTLNEEDGSYTFGYLPSGKYEVTAYFENNKDGGEPDPEAFKWQPAAQEVTVQGDTDVVIHMERLKRN
jgi:hypothetical protein